MQIGPKSKTLKVKDFEEYDFKPRETVSIICQLYLNLGDSDKFCLAVSRDGRSYSPDLFLQAEKVLIKIHKSPEMIMQFNELAAKIKVCFCFVCLFVKHNEPTSAPLIMQLLLSITHYV